MKLSSTIVFFGSGPVAAATLQALVEAGLSFEAVITKPRAPGHRGSVPVLEYAQAHSLPAFTPTNKAELSELFASRTFNSPVGLVVDYGIIIAKQVIDSFPKGIVNSHFSLLPEWRGADPITFAILSGQPKTGVSLMLINEKMDEGMLLVQEEHDIAAGTTAPQLTEQLIRLSNTMVLEYLPDYLAGTINPYPQPTSTATYSRMLSKADGKLDIGKPADVLEREVRAFRGWPKSSLELFGKSIVVTGSRVAQNKNDGALVIVCANNSYLEITQLIGPSGRTMSGADFMRGYKK